MEIVVLVLVRSLVKICVQILSKLFITSGLICILSIRLSLWLFIQVEPVEDVSAIPHDAN